MTGAARPLEAGLADGCSRRAWPWMKPVGCKDDFTLDA
jgi:hypothetical protein